MNAASMRSMAQRCRQLMCAARTNLAKEQLRVWAEEFEEQTANSPGETVAILQSDPNSIRQHGLRSPIRSR